MHLPYLRRGVEALRHAPGMQGPADPAQRVTANQPASWT
jgi:hypothetical protein